MVYECELKEGETQQEFRTRKAKLLYLDRYFLYRGLGYSHNEAGDLAGAYVKDVCKYL